MIGPRRDDEGPPAWTDDPLYHEIIFFFQS
jgi:hypothetical protein